MTRPFRATTTGAVRMTVPVFSKPSLRRAASLSSIFSSATGAATSTVSSSGSMADRTPSSTSEAVATEATSDTASTSP